VDPRLAASLSSGRHGPAARGLDAVRQAAAFPVAAPPTLVGLPRTGVDLIGIGSERMAVVRYGRGLGQIVLVERRASRGDAPLLAGLPRVAVAGTTAHELATPLGSALAFERRGVQVVVAGSVPAVAAEAAAREVAQ
jgi:hypothetical protein